MRVATEAQGVPNWVKSKEDAVSYPKSVEWSPDSYPFRTKCGVSDKGPALKELINYYLCFLFINNWKEIL